MRTSVLLVEDNDDDAALIEHALSRSPRLSFELERVGSVSAAQERLRARAYDAVLVDLGLPDSSGLTTFKAVLAEAPLSAVVVLTGDDEQELGLEAVELGAQEYIVKSERAWQSLAMAIVYACERARREQEVSELTTALAKAVDAIATLDGDGSCVAVNAAFQSVLGYAPEEIVGVPLVELLEQGDRARVGASFARCEVQEVVTRAVRQDGRILPVKLVLVPRAGKRGHFCFVRDLTRQKELEAKLAAAVSVTAVGSLTTGLAHEVNNPLAVVLANLEEAVRVTAELEPSVADDARDELGELRAMLDEAYAASQRMQLIVRDLRAFACSDDRRGRVDINAVIEACANLAFAEIRHRARLHKELTATTPVPGSEAKLAQAVLHLLLNAAQAMPEGDIEKNVITISTRQDGRTAVAIEVSDTGVGIPPEAMHQVAEPFFTTKPRRPGMGLALAQAAVREHGGEMTIRPREGGGTLVRIVLPTLEADVADEAEPAGPPQRRVLVVDDDPLVLRSLARVLAHDFEVAAARNGREALDLVRAGGAFDAMLCDLIMPELSGIELHEVLERDEPELAKRTIFLTGGAFSGRAQSFLETIGQPHLEKPVNLKTVRELLMQVSQTPPKMRATSKWLDG